MNSTPNTAMTTAIDDQIVYDFTPGRNGRMNAVLDAAGRLGREAKQSAIKHVVRPTMDAVHNATDAAHHAANVARQQVAIIEDKAHENPRRTLGVAFGLGLLVGLIIYRR